jgi:predicted 3-demethylubiquinone-9 3-methyltransferase (glyoxalase superfamily)
MIMKQKISTFLWFDSQAEEAVNHYMSIFNNSRIVDVSHYTDAAPGPTGSVMTIVFELEGQQFVALNGGPHFKFTEAISLLVSCDSQAEVDTYWEKLGAGGQWGPCGWLKDKYGLSWQIAPTAAFDMLQDHDRARANRVMAAIMKMKKIDLAALQAAYGAH